MVEDSSAALEKFKKGLEEFGDLEFVGSYKYDKSQGRWVTIFEKIPLPDLKLEKFSVLTWNVWFESHNFDLRGEEIRAITQKLDPDFICFQEVIASFYQKLCDSEWVREKYSISGYGKFSNPYECIILSKHPCNFYKRMFPTLMGRTLKVAELKNNGQKVAVGTVHLESLNNEDYRETQMKISFDLLKNYDEGLLMGDFNFDWPKEIAKIPSDFKDIWNELHKPEEENFTMDKNGKWDAWRPDRILLKKSELITALTIDRIGMEPIKLYRDNPNIPKTGILTPSDHFGLYATFEFSRKPSELVIVWSDPGIQNKENMEYTEQIQQKYKGKGLMLFEKNSERVLNIVDGVNEEQFIIIVNSSIALELAEKHKSNLKKFTSDKRNLLIVFTTEARVGVTQQAFEQDGISEYTIATSFSQVVKAIDGYLASHKIAKSFTELK